MISCNIFILKIFKVDFQKEREDGRGREREKGQCESEKLASCYLHAPNWRASLKPPTYAQTRSLTYNLSGNRRIANQLSHISEGLK